MRKTESQKLCVERWAQGCPLPPGAASDIPKDGSAPRQTGGSLCFGAFCPMTPHSCRGSSVHSGAMEILWAVLLPCFFQSPTKETAATSVPLQQSNLLTD